MHLPLLSQPRLQWSREKHSTGIRTRREKRRTAARSSSSYYTRAPRAALLLHVFFFPARRRRAALLWFARIDFPFHWRAAAGWRGQVRKSLKVESLAGASREGRASAAGVKRDREASMALERTRAPPVNPLFLFPLRVLFRLLAAAGAVQAHRQWFFSGWLCRVARPLTVALRMDGVSINRRQCPGHQFNARSRLLSHAYTGLQFTYALTTKKCQFNYPPSIVVL